MGTSNSCYAFPRDICGCSKGDFCAFFGTYTPPKVVNGKLSITTPPGNCYAAGDCNPKCQTGLTDSFVAGLIVSMIALVVTIALCIKFCGRPAKKPADAEEDDEKYAPNKCGLHKSTDNARNEFIVLVVFMNIFTSAFVMSMFMLAEADKLEDNTCAYNENDIFVSWIVWCFSTAFFTTLGACCIFYCYKTSESDSKKEGGCCSCFGKAGTEPLAPKDKASRLGNIDDDFGPNKDDDDL